MNHEKMTDVSLMNAILCNPNIDVKIVPAQRSERQLVVPSWMYKAQEVLRGNPNIVDKYMRNNTPCEIKNAFGKIAVKRPLSAYFTLKEDGALIVETGLINEQTKEAKLHTYLNLNTDHDYRRKNGFTIISGHFAPEVLINGISSGSLALLDPLDNADTPNSIQLTLVKTLISRLNALPLTATGIPVIPTSR